MTRVSTRSKRPSRGRARLEQTRQVTEKEIARTSPEELANLPADFWEDAAVVVPVAKRRAFRRSVSRPR